MGEPVLAEDFTLSPEGTSVTFKLRRDATFHGAPVTAGDVKWSLDSLSFCRKSMRIV
jgi:peptide/nickel transport system substrate-binding protein